MLDNMKTEEIVNLPSIQIEEIASLPEIGQVEILLAMENGYIYKNKIVREFHLLHHTAGYVVVYADGGAELVSFEDIDNIKKIDTRKQ